MHHKKPQKPICFCGIFVYSTQGVPKVLPRCTQGIAKLKVLAWTCEVLN